MSVPAPLLGFALSALTVVAASAPARPQQRPAEFIDAAEVIANASSWITRFDRSLSGLLFRERYRQGTVGSLRVQATGDALAWLPMDLSMPAGRVLESSMFLLS